MVFPPLCTPSLVRPLFEGCVIPWASPYQDMCLALSREVRLARAQILVPVHTKKPSFVVICCTYKSYRAAPTVAQDGYNQRLCAFGVVKLVPPGGYSLAPPQRSQEVRSSEIWPRQTRALDDTPAWRSPRYGSCACWQNLWTQGQSSPAQSWEKTHFASW